MGVAEISIGQVMGSGVPAYGAAFASQTMTTTTTSAAAALTDANGAAYAIRDGDFVRIVARTTDLYIGIGKSATTAPRRTVLLGTHIDIGPLKVGATINVADIT